MEEGVDDVEFIWDDYLDDTGSVATPPEAFSHVRSHTPLHIHRNVCSTFVMCHVTLTSVSPVGGKKFRERLKERYEGGDL